MCDPKTRSKLGTTVSPVKCYCCNIKLVKNNTTMRNEEHHEHHLYLLIIFGKYLVKRTPIWNQIIKHVVKIGISVLKLIDKLV